MKTALVLCSALVLSGCAASPVWLTVAAPALGYVASLNNLGAQTLKFIDDKDARACKAPPAMDGPK